MNLFNTTMMPIKNAFSFSNSQVFEVKVFVSDIENATLLLRY